MSASSVGHESLSVDAPVKLPASQSAPSTDTLRIRQLRDHHRTMLGLAILIVATAFLLRSGDSGRVSLPWLNVTLPTLCSSRALFGINCPGCGLTRSFIALAAGDLQQSFHHHRLGWLLALAVVAQVPYRIFALRQLQNGIVQRSWPTWFGNLLIAMLIANWLLIVAGG